MYPSDWTVEQFKNVARYKAGKTPSRANPLFWAGQGPSIPWLSISDMKPHRTINESSEKITQFAFERIFRNRIVQAGTLIMSFKLTIGRISTLGFDACHNEAIIAIYPRKNVDKGYLGYFLSHIDYSSLHDRQIKGNTLNQDKIDRLEIALPSFDEQKKIALVLDQLRKAVETERDLLTTSKSLKKEVMRTLFSSGLRGEQQQESEIGLIPNNWNVVTLGSLGRVGNGSTPKKTNPEYWNGGTYPWLTSAKVYDREISVADQFVTAKALNECHLPRIEAGAILIAITGQGKTLGHCAVLAMQATINQHIAYVAVDSKLANSSFLRGYLETKYNYLRQVGSGGGSTKGALTCAFLKTLPIPLPPIDEQNKIVDILDTIDNKIGLHEQIILALEGLFKSLMHKLLTGEIRVIDLDLSALQSVSNLEELLA
jgi:type I restriction enzyme, S subunit